MIPGSCSIHKTGLYIQGRISFEYVKWWSVLRGKGEWHSALSAMLSIGVIAPRYQRVKEDAIGISCYWRSLPVMLQGTDSNTQGKQCVRKESNRGIEHVCVNMFPKDTNTYLSLKVASAKLALQFKEWRVSTVEIILHSSEHLSEITFCVSGL